MTYILAMALLLTGIWLLASVWTVNEVKDQQCDMKQYSDQQYCKTCHRWFDAGDDCKD